MNSTTNPTLIFDYANYIFSRYFDGFENIFDGQVERKRTNTMYVKTHPIENTYQFRMDKEYPDADIRTDIFRAIVKYLKEGGEIIEDVYGWEREILDILCDYEGEFNYTYYDENLTEEEKKELYDDIIIE
tara:strand:- start:46 stop:435 length:390 start_codon:yes stop_codon:yes gene_type:complete